jgi:hypothetical protein
MQKTKQNLTRTSKKKKNNLAVFHSFEALDDEDSNAINAAIYYY